MAQGVSTVGPRAHPPGVHPALLATLWQYGICTANSTPW